MSVRSIKFNLSYLNFASLPAGHLISPSIATFPFSCTHRPSHLLCKWSYFLHILFPCNVNIYKYSVTKKGYGMKTTNLIECGGAKASTHTHTCMYSFTKRINKMDWKEKHKNKQISENSKSQSRAKQSDEESTKKSIIHVNVWCRKRTSASAHTLLLARSRTFGILPLKTILTFACR